MAGKAFKKVKETLLPVISGVAFVLLIWLLIYGKIKAGQWLAPLIERLPKNESALVKMTESVLGAAASRLKEGSMTQKALERGNQIFEESDYLAPARDMRDDLKNRIDETVQSAKDLPAKEIKQVQREVCRKWLGDEIIMATPSGENDQ